MTNLGEELLQLPNLTSLKLELLGGVYEHDESQLSKVFVSAFSEDTYILMRNQTEKIYFPLSLPEKIESLLAPTLNQSNSGPRLRPLVISQGSKKSRSYCIQEFKEQ